MPATSRHFDIRHWLRHAITLMPADYATDTPPFRRHLWLTCLRHFAITFSAYAIDYAMIYDIIAATCWDWLHTDYAINTPYFHYFDYAIIIAITPLFHVQLETQIRHFFDIYFTFSYWHYCAIWYISPLFSIEHFISPRYCRLLIYLYYYDIDH
jgi:hypothetical protein